MARILVVDDEATLLATLRFNLEREGFDVITSSDGGDAIKLVDSEHPDLILLDLMLPGMHGFEVCRTLRKRTSVPIVILTARTEEVDRVVGLELGADDYSPSPSAWSSSSPAFEPACAVPANSAPLMSRR